MNFRLDSYFIGGFKYDGKAVFGVIESVGVSRLVMTCANRAEIIRKATLNCSTDMFDQSRSFAFHILSTHLTSNCYRLSLLFQHI